MSVIKVRIQKDFTIIYNGVLENPRLSFKAKGLWAYCMSKPDNWQFHVCHLAKVSKEGIDSIYSALKELQAEGLVKKSQENTGGCFGKMDYIIYPYPQEIQIILPLRDFPQTEDPQTVNPALVSTDSLPRTDLKKNPPLPPPATKEEEEEISKRLRERPKDLPKIKSMKAWRNVVLEEIRSTSVNEKSNFEQTYRHRARAIVRDMTKNSDGELICAYQEYVEFSCGSKIRKVRYDLSAKEWEQQTKWN